MNPPNSLQLVIVTGTSGGGKTNTLRILEDYGYFCIDNLIPALIPPFAEMISKEFSLVAVVIDTRVGSFFSELSDALQKLKVVGVAYSIVFIDASEESLVKRFSETRRRHPLLNQSNSLIEAIQNDRELLVEVRSYADLIIDTSSFSLSQLRKTITESLIDSKLITSSLRISIVSFGFKYGLPADADLVFDVRFLANPHYIPELKPKTGLDKDIQDFVYEKEVTRKFLLKLFDIIEFLVPNYKAEGKTSLTIAIGCTGGRHRSVAIANKLATHLKDSGCYIFEKHRDIDKNQKQYEM